MTLSLSAVGGATVNNKTNSISVCLLVSGSDMIGYVVTKLVPWEAFAGPQRRADKVWVSPHLGGFWDKN